MTQINNATVIGIHMSQLETATQDLTVFIFGIPGWRRFRTSMPRIRDLVRWYVLDDMEVA